MIPFLVLIRMHLLESRWFLSLGASAMFGLGWIFVHVTSLIESKMRLSGAGSFAALLESKGGSMSQYSSVAMEMTWWNNPAILLMIALWAISRGSIAVAGELERGTLDWQLSRPVSRAGYLCSHILVAVLGQLILVAALVAGNLAATQVNHLESPPALLTLLKPAFNLAVLGVAIFGYTLMISAASSVRWRPNLIGSVVTMGGFIILVIAYMPSMDDWKWIESLSIFRAYTPVEVVIKGESLLFNTGILGLIASVGMLVGYFVFRTRDLPSSA
jgi:ABC-2 type transport system permease protein